MSGQRLPLISIRCQLHLVRNLKLWYLASTIISNTDRMKLSKLPWLIPNTVPWGPLLIPLNTLMSITSLTRVRLTLMWTLSRRSYRRRAIRPKTRLWTQLELQRSKIARLSNLRSHLLGVQAWLTLSRRCAMDFVLIGTTLIATSKRLKHILNFYTGIGRQRGINNEERTLILPRWTKSIVSLDLAVHTKTLLTQNLYYSHKILSKIMEVSIRTPSRISSKLSSNL
jgi:hypothetical protein